MSGIILKNQYLDLELDSLTGGVRQLRHAGRELHLVEHEQDSVVSPWRIEVDGQVWIEEFDSFQFTATEQRAELHWIATNGLAVHAVVTLDGPDVTFQIDVEGLSGAIVDKVEYPVIGGIGSLQADADHYLAHPQGTGFLFRNPATLFTTEKPGLRYSPYPEGFSGSSLQCFSYYAERFGGFSFSTYDASGAMKWLNFWKHEDGYLRTSFIHQSPEVRPGNGYAPSYGVTISTLDHGTWYEAADRYKAWAIQQPWASRGRLSERSGWLHDEVGYSTFGINSACDRSAWLNKLHTIGEGRVFHVMGVNWPNFGGDYHGVHPGGREDWFPARFNEANLETVRENGDYWAPFEFDLLQDPKRSETSEIEASLVQFQDEKYSFDAYHFPFQCPVTPYLRELHTWRDETLVREHHADAIYYDISANNVTMQCRSDAHGHPVGGGSWMVDAYRNLWAATGERLAEVSGHRVPQGAEMVNEVFLDRLDFYQARAGAAPLSPFESGFFRDWIIAGDCEKIPLFTYVYHEYGPVRMDGWGKLSRETGELWYWVAARVALWGGLYQLNYEFSPLEVLDGVMEDTSEHYATIDDIPREIDPAKADFVREIASARIGFAKPYLVFGTMLQPLEFECADLDLDWMFYNFNPKSDIYGQGGSHRVNEVQHVAWRSPDGRLGFFFVNLHPTGEVELPVTIDLARYGSHWSSVAVEYVTRSERRALFAGDAASGLEYTIRLSPRQVTLIEVSPLEGE